MQRFERWTDVYAQLVQVDQKHALEPEKIERLALAAYLIGKEGESFLVLERAHHGYLEQGKIEKDIRCAFWLSLRR